MLTLSLRIWVTYSQERTPHNKNEKASFFGNLHRFAWVVLDSYTGALTELKLSVHFLILNINSKNGKEIS